ncbi:hypothetical protein [Maricaulis parjimensis]|uniref:hypothetical protein n=1 Tax=Maricaulis parjimensis TaxID=144023 RepID=UPI001939353B|nr:hypothetical protein [Maricaulis parjimensis]
MSFFRFTVTGRMAHTIKLEAEGRWADIYYRGEVHSDHPAQLIEAMVKLPGWTPRCDRIIHYDDAQLGEMTALEFRTAAARLQDVITRHYGPSPNFSVHVCSNPMQRPILEYWMTLGRSIYSPVLNLVDTEKDAREWLVRQRAPGGVADQAQPV